MQEENEGVPSEVDSGSGAPKADKACIHETSCLQMATLDICRECKYAQKGLDATMLCRFIGFRRLELCRTAYIRRHSGLRAYFWRLTMQHRSFVKY